VILLFDKSKNNIKLCINIFLKFPMSVGAITVEEATNEGTNNQAYLQEVMHAVRDLPAELAANFRECLRLALGDNAANYILMREKKGSNAGKDKSTDGNSRAMSNREKKRLNKQRVGKGQDPLHMDKKK
jgi:hypothetical protein|tara:strand:- start:202 stop:588 length:387 start_codon:yes stop_codon:yes gene_type:complete